MITLQCCPKKRLLCLHLQLAFHFYNPCGCTPITLLVVTLQLSRLLLYAIAVLDNLNGFFPHPNDIYYFFRIYAFIPRRSDDFHDSFYMMNDDFEPHYRSASADTPGLIPADEKTNVAEVSDALLAAKPKSSPSKSQPEAKTDANANNKITKRRAARACASCRTRKVRCDVVEQYPCANCRWDHVDCIVQESRRRRCVTSPFLLFFCFYFLPLLLICPGTLVHVI